MSRLPVSTRAAANAATPFPHSRVLVLPASEEPGWKRGLYLILALLVAWAFFYVTQSFFAPAPGQPGVDEHAYLVAGKNIAYHGSPALHPASPYEYVGLMWMPTRDGWFYPKYPAGVPLLHAVAIWIDRAPGHFSAFYVSPLCATLAVLGVFLLARLVVAPFLALLAAILLASNPTLLQLANAPLSHAAALAFAVWGMYALACWWQRPTVLRGVAAGFLLGYTFTVRYSEGLLVLPLVFTAIASLRWTHWRSYLRAAVPLLAWAVPVVGLLAFNYFASGRLTGYDSTHESTGFTWAEFLAKWDFTIEQLYLFGLFLLFPLGLLGLLLLLGSSWRIALLFWLWVLPAGLLYTAYYWGQHIEGVGFLRFFLTIYPPLIVAGLWLLGAAGRGAGPGTRARGAIMLPLTAGLLTAAAAALGVSIAMPELARQQLHVANLAFSARQFLQTVPAADRRRGQPPPLVFADAGLFPQLLQYLQFTGDAEWYAADAFTPHMGGSLLILDSLAHAGRGAGADRDGTASDAPVLIAPDRAAALQALYHGKTEADLIAAQHAVIAAALAQGRPVYALLTIVQVRQFRRALRELPLDIKSVTRWKEPLRSEDESPRGIFFGPGPRDFDARHNALAPPPWGGGFLDRGQPTLYLLQITAKTPAASAPASAPAP